MSGYTCFRVRHSGDAVVLDLNSPILYDHLLDAEFKDELSDFIEQQRPDKLVINFTDVHHCPTSLINGLVSAQRRLTYGGRMTLCAMDPRVRDVFRILKLDGTVFEIHEGEAEAGRNR